MRRALLAALLGVAASTASAQMSLQVSHQIGSTTAQLYWTPNPGAVSYTVSRTHHVPAYEFVVSTSALTASVQQPADTSYAYVIFAMDQNGATIPGGASNMGLVSSFAFTDPALATTTPIRAVHVTELRTAVAAARDALHGWTTSWSSTVAAGSPILASDITGLRDGLALNTAQGYDDPSLTGLPVRKRHVEQLRLRVSTFPEYVNASLTVSNPYFSPNGDGQKDTTTVSATMAPNADPRWLINVRNGAGTIIRTFSGSGSAVAYAWDGRNAAGTIQSEGSYTFELVDGDGLTTPVAPLATTTIDLTPPSVAIVAPTPAQVFSNLRQNFNGDITITGTAMDSHFGTWSMNETSPQAISLGGGSAAVTSTATLGVLHTLPNTGPLANGPHVLTLSAIDQAGNSNSTAVTVSLGNFSVSQNVNQLNLGASGQVTYTSIVPFTMTETIQLRTSGNTVVRTLVNQSRTAGTYSDTWDGRNDSGVAVPDGTYTYAATGDEGTGAITWTQAGQFLGSVVTQFPYPRCRDASGAITSCDAVPFDPFTNQPLRLVYCNAGTGPTSPCTYGGPMIVVIKASPGDETTSACDYYCIDSFVQADGDQEYAWYGQPLTFISPPANRISVIRRNDTLPRNMTFVYGSRPVLTNLVISPLLFSPGAGTAANGSLTLSFGVTSFQSRPVVLKAEFRNQESGSLLRTITTPSGPAGSRTISWDGRADNGAWVAPALYEVTVTVTDSEGNATSIRPYVTVRY
jgi:flagellar hook assembly protein FlgD